MPKRKVSPDGAARLSAKPAPAKVDAKPQKAMGKDKSSDKKCKPKGRREQKGKQAEVADQQNTDVPAENGETESQSPASEVEEKEAKSD
ncbi:non-histone chromosomal protein HMG-14-like [Onychomys torridus]|uniref:non-histone chromosomal protein HMG-14-like n=1 Tax=Onychomys torridus TaxID=38674 RepID=UPI00167FCBC5|nr:non-histone chromosomal protein HMG-14-like [Onychomys torridus]